MSAEEPRDSARVVVPIPELVWKPTNLQLFRFSAVTWNSHRIHYDLEEARREGFPDVLVQSHLHGCYLLRTVLDWAGPGAILRRFSWRNRAVASPGDELTCSGEASVVEGLLVGCDIREVNQDGVVVATAAASLEFADYEQLARLLSPDPALGT
jgi:hydroxyacyl-ACP dehydratase HTD2-like protein with hotdog domain